MERKDFLKLIGLSGSTFLFAGIAHPNFTTAFDLQKVTIYDNYIRGENFYRKNLKQLTLSVGQAVKLERDYQNKHDKFATKVTVNELQIGYLAAYENIVIANMLDTGVQLSASISELVIDFEKFKSPEYREYSYLHNTIAVKIETELMVPLQNYNITDLTKNRADNAEDYYRRGHNLDI